MSERKSSKISKGKIILTGIAVLMIVSVSAVTIAGAMMNKNVKKEVEKLFSSVDNSGEIVTGEALEGLPESVQRWLRSSGAVGQEKTVAVRVKQKALMRLSEDQSWMPVEAEQYFSVEEPGFIWKARIQAAPMIHIAGRDRYYEGKGNMLIKPLSLFKVADSKGEEIDQGSMLRYLAEIMWFPSAALEDYITWEEIDEDRAKATMTHKDMVASGVFTFNDMGEAILFEAERYGEFDGEFRLETWAIPVREYQEFEGIRVPARGEVTWRLEGGDFNWFIFEVQEIRYNDPVSY